MKLCCTIAIAFLLTSMGAAERAKTKTLKLSTEIPETQSADSPKPPEIPKADDSKPSDATKPDVQPTELSKKDSPKSKPEVSEVQKYDKRRDRIAISDDPNHPWAKKDQTCVYRHNRALACGKVIAVGIKGAVVQLQPHAASLKAGDEVRYIPPDKNIPQITDEQLETEHILEAKPFTYNAALGYSLSLDLRYPIGHFYWSVSPLIAIGIQPAYLKVGGSNDASSLKGFGALLTVNYFSQEYFRGLWAQLGSGFYRLSATNGTLEEKINAPMLTVTGGWREDWAHGLNLGASLGLRFLSPLSGTITEVKYSTIHVIALVEIGFSF